MANGTVDEFGVSAARIEAATLLRRLGHAIVGHHVDDDQLLALTAAVTPFVELMEVDPPRFRAQSGRDGASHFEAPPEDGAVLEHFRIVREAAFTGQLTVNYRAPTPMGQELTFRAWVTGREGRKLFIGADARHDGDLWPTPPACS